MPKLNRIITIKFIATNDLLKKFCLEDAKFEVVHKKKHRALLASANEMLDEVSKLDEEHRLSVGWKIMLKDFKSGIIKLNKQYFQQLEEKEIV
jgi:superoxide dismutase